MGDVGTHYTVTRYVRDQLRKSPHASLIPPGDYTYLELGNFLTDISQFRDPPAHHRAREDVWRKAVQGFIVPIAAPLAARAWGGREWVEGVWGVDEPGREHGSMARFFQHVALAACHNGFADDSPFAPAFEFEPLPPSEVDRVFEDFFTQYWPHEHLDFPPVRDLHDHRERRLWQPTSRRRLFGYLEWDIQYLSEELSKLELDWIRALITNAPAQRRRDLLVRLGNLLHPIEDFFFHSNFVELRQWQHVQGSYPTYDAQTPMGRQSLALVGLSGTGLFEASRGLRRIFYRRLRYPRYDRRGKLTDESEDATRFVYTGGFGQTDVFHTLAGSLESLERRFRQIILPDGSELAGKAIPPGGSTLAAELANSDLILIRLFFNRAARRQMIEDDLKDDHAETHEQQLIDGEVRQGIHDLRDPGLTLPNGTRWPLLSQRAEEELLLAFDNRPTTTPPNRRGLDLWVEEEFSAFPGLGGLLVHILAELEREHRESEKRQRRLDGGSEVAIFYEGSTNGASVENVGTHSLMSKDSDEKQPLRADAEILARHASASIALLLLERVATNHNPRQGLDWDTLIRFYLRFPRTRPDHWYNELIRRLRSAGSAFHQPDVGDIADQPNFGLLGPDRQPEKLAQRRRGDTRRRLEHYYSQFQFGVSSNSGDFGEVHSPRFF